jgi:hypothetical protein
LTGFGSPSTTGVSDSVPSAFLFDTEQLIETPSVLIDDGGSDVRKEARRAAAPETKWTLVGWSREATFDAATIRVTAFAKRAGYAIAAEYYDQAVSGADELDARPGFCAMLEHIAGNGVRTSRI